MTNWLINKLTQNPTDPATRNRCGRMAGVIGICCNLTFFISKFLIGLASGSISVMADAFNNLSDVAAALLSTIGFAAAALPADEKHPFGHGRGEYLAGLGVAGLMLVVGFQFLKSSVQKILHPEPIVYSHLMMGILIVYVLLKIWLSHFYTQVGKRIHSTPLIATGKDSRNDVLTTLVVIAGVVAEHLFHIYIDGWVGLIIALFILYSCYDTARDTISPLLGESADPEMVQRIAHRILHYDDRIMGIHDLMVHDYGPDRRFVTLHMEIDAKEDVLGTHDLIDSIERAIKEEEHVQLLIHHDPVVTDDPVQNNLRRVIKDALKARGEHLGMHDFRLCYPRRRGENYMLRFDVVKPASVNLTKAELCEYLQSALRREIPEEAYDLDITLDKVESFNLYLKDA